MTPSGRLLTVPLVPPGCVQEALAVMHQELVLRVLGCPQEQGQQVPAVNHPTGRSTGTQGGAAEGGRGLNKPRAAPGQSAPHPPAHSAFG